MPSFLPNSIISFIFKNTSQILCCSLGSCKGNQHVDEFGCLKFNFKLFLFTLTHRPCQQLIAYQQFYPYKGQIPISTSIMQIKVAPQNNTKHIKHYTYNQHDLIGTGNFSKVYKANNLKNNQQVAIKVVSLDLMKSKHIQSFILQEINILKTAKHPNILKLHEVIMSDRNCYLVTELCKEGSLQEIIKRKGFNCEQISNIVFDVYQGLKYLRNIGVCHRDIKAANIFMKDGKAKIADFGLSKFYKQKFKDLDIGSPLFMSPQGLIYNTYSQKTDIWSFGIFIFELLHGKSPFVECKNDIELKNAVIKPIPEHMFRKDIPTQLRQLINMLLTIDEQQRPSIYDLQKNSYIKGLLPKNVSPLKRITHSSGLNIVQTSKTLTQNKTKIDHKKQKTDKLQTTESIKLDLLSSQTPKKIIGLGNYHKIKHQSNKYKQPMTLYTPQTERNIPFSMKSIESDNLFLKDPETIRNIGRHRVNSNKTIETRDSEEDRNLFSREHKIYSHLRK